MQFFLFCFTDAASYCEKFEKIDLEKKFNMQYFVLFQKKKNWKKNHIKTYETSFFFLLLFALLRLFVCVFYMAEYKSGAHMWSLKEFLSNRKKKTFFKQFYSI